MINPTQKKPPTSLPPPQDFTFPGDGNDLKDIINKKGQLQNFIPIRSKADGTGNVVQHPHITSSQEQRGLIQNRRQRLGWAGCQVHHLSSSQGSNTHPFSLCFSLDPTDPLAKVGKLSVCCLWRWICHISFTQHHKQKPCWSQEGPDAEQDPSPHQAVFPARKGQGCSGLSWSNTPQPLWQAAPVPSSAQTLPQITEKPQCHHHRAGSCSSAKPGLASGFSSNRNQFREALNDPFCL